MANILTVITIIIASVTIWLLVRRRQNIRQISRRVLVEDTLKHIHNCEHHGRIPMIESIAGVLNCTVDEIVKLLTEMQKQHLIEFEGDMIKLTAQGRDYARHIIRAHRLWERYLADKTGYTAEEWHSQSELREHEISPAEADALALELGHPRYDPHGDPIPTADGDLISPSWQVLSSLPPNQPARIVHLEDEPETIYAQLLAKGLYLGMVVTITEVTSQQVRFLAGGAEYLLTPIVAANVSVLPLQQEEKVATIPFKPLSNLKLGETGKVVDITRASRGVERRRFMDLGILPGAVIKPELVSPTGDPTAYRIRGALIALRKEQAGLINITCDLKSEIS